METILYEDFSSHSDDYDFGVHLIVDAAELASGYNSNSIKEKKSPPAAIWWTDECSEAVQVRREALKEFRNSPSIETEDAYKNAKKALGI